MKNAVVTLASKIFGKLKSQYLISIYRSNSDPRVFDWDWKAVNFNRVALVNNLGKRIGNPRYLEIGCDDNQLFDSVDFDKKVGVDPSKGGTLRVTSDAFFEKQNNEFDLVFIDGLHTHSQARRDVVNSLSNLSEHGWIALHDMLPRTWKEAHVPRLTDGNWTGDVWKLAFELAATPGLDFKIIRIDNGVGVIRCSSDYSEVVDLSSTLESASFSYYADHVLELPTIEWAEALEWISEK